MLKHLIYGFAFLAAGAGIFFATARPGLAQQSLIVQLLPAETRPGQMVLVRVSHTENVTYAEASLDGRRVPLYQTIDGDWAGFIGVDMATGSGERQIQVTAWADEVVVGAQNIPLMITWGGFLYQNINVSPGLVGLLDPTLNDEEEQTLLRVYERVSPYKLWDGSFVQPVPGMMISEFGGIRTYNGGLLEGRHTGVDFRAGTGEPIAAAASGRVVFAQALPIRGNHVVIDHGLGVYSAYSHMREIFVVPGQRVLQGDIIGEVGATGRVEGAHFHFELSVNGVWVDPIQFLSTGFPEARYINIR